MSVAELGTGCALDASKPARNSGSGAVAAPFPPFPAFVWAAFALAREDNTEFYADCGYSAREVQGPAGSDTSPKGTYLDDAGNRIETARSKNSADFRDEIFVKAGLCADKTSAHAAYNALSDVAKDAFDKKHGINKYAAPGVGEAFTRQRDDMLGGTGFNFHWGGVIMVVGGDRVTVENYTKGRGYEAKDEDWYFATYGPPSKAGQTWHERWQSVGGLGKGDGSSGSPPAALSSTRTPDPVGTAATRRRLCLRVPVLGR